MKESVGCWQHSGGAVVSDERKDMSLVVGRVQLIWTYFV